MIIYNKNKMTLIENVVKIIYNCMIFNIINVAAEFV